MQDRRTDESDANIAVLRIAASKVSSDDCFGICRHSLIRVPFGHEILSCHGLPIQKTEFVAVAAEHFAGVIAAKPPLSDATQQITTELSVIAKAEFPIRLIVRHSSRRIQLIEFARFLDIRRFGWDMQLGSMACEQA